MTILPVTLATAGFAALINMWLSMRIGRIRIKERISIGAGGNDRLEACMRAQANFIEYAPIVLILLALIELALGSPAWLWGVAGVFLVSRVLHGIGMDGWMPGRQWGIAGTMLVMLGLAFTALAIPWLAF
ncbi:MAPEG family protein [Sphingomonas canadensis]|uniref:MAPEG family protein n=1 Tax=Sphingomonas canadensis TaxID=1219257 RepID=A0ABW3H1M5_9SPHN|nr:MAPEG family protein [Sphingomonas canadensis]MCW3834749.1 MAPEG family protein [Sphingomonas canadensis]